MASLEIKSGTLISLQDLHQSSPFFKQGASLRITGKLREYSIEACLATIIDGDDILKVSTEHLRDLSFQVGSVYQFIGELLIQPDNEFCKLVLVETLMGSISIFTISPCCS
ncbi:CST complex subunit TEN1 isoform X2 [Vigna umbellata]|uniref:CST complex subunit TEN1 isoform X2 n=1 Tax=Vigna umbellata TaxID=87088 RepID=UPI001F5E8C98|nr:CST complex subunit TEN1 isoform X2 [Vigna umbellata]